MRSSGFPARALSFCAPARAPLSPRRAAPCVASASTTTSRPKKFLSSNLFYPLLDVFIANLLTQRNVVVFPFYDQRDYKKLHTVPAPIRIMASEGELDAVIATTIFPKHTGWLQRLEVPVASLMLPAPERNIAIGFAQVAAKVVEIAVQHHRKTIGLIHAWVPSTEKEKTDVLGEEIRRLAALHGISVFQPMDIAKHPHGHSMHPDQLGEELCQQLLDDPAPPDMIFVHPDIFVRGVAAALHRRVPVPEKVLVVSHRNAENGAYIPFPMTWITVHIKDFAAALIDQIDRQIAGEKITPVAVPLTVEQSAPFRVPDDSAS